MGKVYQLFHHSTSGDVTLPCCVCGDGVKAGETLADAQVVCTDCCMQENDAVSWRSTRVLVWMTVGGPFYEAFGESFRAELGSIKPSRDRTAADTTTKLDMFVYLNLLAAKADIEDKTARSKLLAVVDEARGYFRNHLAARRHRRVG